MTLVDFVPLLTLIVINTGLVALPLYMILRKAGKSRLLALIALFPFGGGVVVMWILALSRWESQVSQEAQGTGEVFR